MCIRLQSFGAVCLLIVLTLLTVSCSWQEERGRDNLAPIPFGSNFTPQWSPDGRFLVTYADLGLIAVDANGRRIWSLGQRPRESLSVPALAVDGRLAYTKMRRKSRLGIFIGQLFVADYDPARRSLEFADTDANGNRAVASVDLANFRHSLWCWSAWSPDGAQVACHGAGNISIVDRTGVPVGNFRLDPPAEWDLSGGFFGVTHMDWSPDGQRIAMIVEYGSVENPEYSLLTVQPDGSNLRALVSAAGYNALSALEWSADGQRIFVIQTPPGGPAELVSVQSNGSRQDRLAILDRAERADAPVYIPGESALQLSPDGKRLLLTYRKIWMNDLELGVATSSVHTVNTDGSNLRLVSRQDDALYTSWSPDGSRIAVATPHNDAAILYTMDTDGGDIKVLLERNASGEIVSGYGKHTATGGDGESR